jgi:hypothetical protein
MIPVIPGARSANPEGRAANDDLELPDQFASRTVRNDGMEWKETPQ